MGEFWLDTSRGYTEQQESKGYEPLPEGNYQVSVEDICVVETRKKRDGEATKGEMIKLELVVIGGDGAGYRIWHNFNISNDSRKAEEIGKRQFVEFSKACNVELVVEEPKTADWCERESLFNQALKPFLDKTCVVSTKNETWNGKVNTRVSKFYPASSAASSPTLDLNDPEIPF